MFYGWSLLIYYIWINDLRISCVSTKNFDHKHSLFHSSSSWLLPWLPPTFMSFKKESVSPIMIACMWKGMWPSTGAWMTYQRAKPLNETDSSFPGAISCRRSSLGLGNPVSLPPAWMLTVLRSCRSCAVTCSCRHSWVQRSWSIQKTLFLSGCPLCPPVLTVLLSLLQCSPSLEGRGYDVKVWYFIDKLNSIIKFGVHNLCPSPRLPTHAQ